MPDTSRERPPTLAAAKFSDPHWTASGEQRASVALARLRTLWFNTGTLCNIACDNCYIESSPTNDRLAYLSREDVEDYLDEIDRLGYGVEEIGYTGGEPFMNRDCAAMIALSLARGYTVLVLTNAMKPLHHARDALLDLHRRHGQALTLRVSVDHYRQEQHESVRGPGTWQPMIDGLTWLAQHGFHVTVASRTLWQESEHELRAGFAGLFRQLGIGINCDDPTVLVLFPEMDLQTDVPEITERCWGILGVSPEDMMCATSRMVIKRKGEASPAVVPCTLLPYDTTLELGRHLADAVDSVRLNHPFCAQFCVLGGASCSAG
ncbi:MAG: radical SAM protein [Hyphomicrobiales bacterium]|nr:radical SAM protein [Hyphomicrobiales bacterium]